METNETTSKEAPWTDETFDAEKAWILVSNLRKENGTLKQELAGLREQAGKAENLEAKLAEYEKAFADKEAELKAVTEQSTKTRLLAERSIPDSFAQMLTGDDEEAWTAAADLLAAFRDGAKPQADDGLKPDPVQTAVNIAPTEEAQRLALAERIFA
ncbi:capsid assembly scaffolding protein Gp46 family protein [Mobiluncus mulieris]|uniref:capsid assembly scaffolding protein Gp46 family protein n=1 Tax=Mobiluncus mulieris TaxID=2052 RepID=UPI00146FF477|nr:DUF4355 domain-containing protein [Mobiluncus mulieris]NMX11166.1 hypothetical protein [Mobiluncus mulieris]